MCKSEIGYSVPKEVKNKRKTLKFQGFVRKRKLKFRLTAMFLNLNDKEAAESLYTKNINRENGSLRVLKIMKMKRAERL